MLQMFIKFYLNPFMVVTSDAIQEQVQKQAR